MRTVRVGTRTSALAMAQAEAVIAAMKSKSPELDFEIVPLKTRGDRLADVPLADFGGKGSCSREELILPCTAPRTCPGGLRTGWS